MARVHKFIVAVRTEERNIREGKRKEKDPFGTKEVEKQLVADHCNYEEDGGNCAKLHLRKLRRQECQSEDQWLQDNRTLNFLSHTRWAVTEQAEGGLTWLELFIWYTMHSGPDEKTPLDAKRILPAELANFKASIRRVNLHCVAERDEWNLQTSYARGNRLHKVAVSNKHATLRGSPKIDPKEAEAITRAMLAMRGLKDKKHFDAHAKGQLRLRSWPLTYRSSVVNWRTMWEPLRHGPPFTLHLWTQCSMCR